MTPVRTILSYRQILMFSCLVLISQAAQAGNLFHVGDVMARDWSDLFDRFLEEKVSIYVTSEEHEDFVVFWLKDGYPEGFAKITYAESIQRNMESAVEKAISYSGIAKENQADVSKEIGCFKARGRFQNSDCYSSSLRFKFFSNNSGRQTDLILGVEEEYPHDGWRRIYFGEAQQRRLLAMIKRISEAFVQAHRNRNKEKLFN